MRFNKDRSSSRDKTSFEDNKEVIESVSHTNISTIADSNRLIVVGTIKVDEHSRLTFSKRIKNVFPILPNDTIVVYQDISNNNLIFKVQRYTEVSDTWIIKRAKNNINNSSNNYTSKNTFNEANKDYKKDKERPQKAIYNIMIIDDEQDIASLFKAILLNEGKNSGINYNIDRFSSSSEALKRFLDTNNKNDGSLYYDLILIDIKMPDINGIQLYQILKIVNLNVKVLFISALDAGGDLAGVLPGIKSDDIIRKPIENEFFISKVKEKLRY